MISGGRDLAIGAIESLFQHISVYRVLPYTVIKAFESDCGSIHIVVSASLVPRLHPAFQHVLKSSIHIVVSPKLDQPGVD